MMCIFSHPSTNQARPCLASEIRRDRARSGWYGRRLMCIFYAHMESVFVKLLWTHFKLRVVVTLERRKKETDVGKQGMLAIPAMLKLKGEREI